MMVPSICAAVYCFISGFNDGGGAIICFLSRVSVRHAPKGVEKGTLCQQPRMLGAAPSTSNAILWRINKACSLLHFKL